MSKNLSASVALITGASRRIGKQIAIELHRNQFNIVVHYHQSQQPAIELAETLNTIRQNSCIIIQADLTDNQALNLLVSKSAKQWGKIDLLVNNASTFFPTKLQDSNQSEWDNLFATNLKAPYFLSQAALPYLTETKGSIINIIDIYGIQPLLNHSIYCMAKAGLVMMTKSLAKELAPNIRVNGIAPGAILWPQTDAEEDRQKQQKIIQKTALKRQGAAEDIAKTVNFLALEANYITGQIIKVDGGRF